MGMGELSSLGKSAPLILLASARGLYFPLLLPWVSNTTWSWALYWGPADSLWRVPGTNSESFWIYLLVTLLDSPNKGNLSGHTTDPVAQLESGPLSSCSLPCFLWWQILIFLMTKRLFTPSGRLGIAVPCFRVRTATLITSPSRMF